MHDPTRVANNFEILGSKIYLRFHGPKFNFCLKYGSTEVMFTSLDKSQLLSLVPCSVLKHQMMHVQYKDEECFCGFSPCLENAMFKGNHTFHGSPGCRSRRSSFNFDACDSAGSPGWSLTRSGVLLLLVCWRSWCKQRTESSRTPVSSVNIPLTWNLDIENVCIQFM